MKRLTCPQTAGHLKAALAQAQAQARAAGSTNGRELANVAASQAQQTTEQAYEAAMATAQTNLAKREPANLAQQTLSRQLACYRFGACVSIAPAQLEPVWRQPYAPFPDRTDPVSNGDATDGLSTAEVTARADAIDRHGGSASRSTSPRGFRSQA